MGQLRVAAKMALRNVLKYRRRSLSTFVVVFVGVAAIVVVDAFMNGFYDRLVAEFATAGGHVRVSAPGYAVRRATCPLDMLVADPKALASAAAAAGGPATEVGPAKGGAAGFARVAAMPMLRAACAVQSGDRAINLYAVGADAYLPGVGLAPPLRAARLSAGRVPAPGERGALLSRAAAARLGASVGDRLIFLASDAFGSFGAIELPLLGVTMADPGPEACFLDLGSMRELVGVEAGAAEVALYLVDGDGRPVDPRGFPERVSAIAGLAQSSGLEAERWDSESSPIAAMIDFFDLFMIALYAIFAVVAGAGIANSSYLSIQDRMRDFGTLRAIAFSSPWVKAIVAIETLAVGMAASLAAAACAWSVFALIGPEGIHLPEATGGIAEWMPEHIPARVDPAAVVRIVALGSVLPLAAAAYPLHVLGRLSIREALSAT